MEFVQPEAINTCLCTNTVKMRSNLFLFNFTPSFHNVTQNGNFANSVQNQKLSTHMSKRRQEEQEFFSHCQKTHVKSLSFVNV